MSKVPVHPIFLAALASGAALALLGGDKVRSRSEWLERFGSWAGPASDTEDEKVTRTERLVREALEKNRYLAEYNLRCIGHGSSKNNTNVKRSSDLDLIAMCEEAWCLPWPTEVLPFTPNGRSLADSYAELRSRVLSALQDEFGWFAIDEGTKCLKLSETASTRVACDILPCFRFRQYLPRAMWQRWNDGNPFWREGIIFLTASGEQIVSYPEQHLANGRQKNVATGYRYKQTVRILKKIKVDMEAQQTILSQERLPSSFEIECALYNVPNSLLTNGDLFDAVDGAVRWLPRELQTPAASNALQKANGIDQLFPAWHPTNNAMPSAPPSQVTQFGRFAGRVCSLINKRT